MFQIPNLLLQGKCHLDMTSVLFGGRLMAFNKKVGWHPSHCSWVHFAQTGFQMCQLFRSVQACSLLAPRQMGAGVKGGCEAAVHATLRFLGSLQPGSVIAKLDFSNAFNCLHRDSMLEAVSQQIPEIYNYCHSAYTHHSILWFDEQVIWSEEDPRQGDPLGSLVFCLTVQPLPNSLQSPLVAGYMDDFTLGGPEDVVYRDIAVVTSTGTSLGLHLNVATCELVHPQSSAIKSAVLGSFKSIAPDEAKLLGAPLLTNKSLDTALDMCCSNLSKAISRLSHIEAHDALVLLWSCFCAPKIQHILRCTPCHGHQALTTFDNLLKSGLTVVTNCNLSDV